MKIRMFGLAVVLLALGGCATGPKSVPAVEPQPLSDAQSAEEAVSADGATRVSGESSGSGSASGAETRGLGVRGAVQMDPLDDPGSPLAARVVYFDFDQSRIRSEFRDQILAHGEYLSRHAGTQLRLEGHADERGTRAYNLALGERRAKAVRNLLLLTGASRHQLDMMSYGEERPAVMGHSEAAWSKNRRVEFVYTAR